MDVYLHPTLVDGILIYFRITSRFDFFSLLLTFRNLTWGQMSLESRRYVRVRCFRGARPYASEKNDDLIRNGKNREKDSLLLLRRESVTDAADTG